MQYAVLIYDNPGAYESLSAAEYEQIMGEYMALGQDPATRGGAQLQPVQTATTVRVSDGASLITDGPFAATKEVFAGFYMIDVAELDAALEFAARIPAARLGGSVELRPIVEQ
jgi:hypothetical protein